MLAHWTNVFLTYELRQELEDLVVFMARYGRQDMDTVSSWPVSKLWRRFNSLARMMERAGAELED